MAKRKFICKKAEHYNRQDFIASIRAMRKAGGAKQKAAEKVMAILQAADFGIPEFAKLTNHGESRIKNCFKYNLPGACRLVTVESESVVWLLYVGDHEEVEHWIEQHKGLRVTVDKRDKSIKYTKTGLSRNPDEISTAAGTVTDDNMPLLQRFDFPELKELVPQKRILGELLTINEETEEEEILEITEMVAESKVQTLILDLLILSREGLYDDAKARLKLHFNQAVDATEEEAFVGEALESRSNLEGIIDFEHLPPDEMERLLSPDGFEDWMLFLHPEQKRVVDEDYDRPCILKGVSGSGKTVVLIHRARRLAQQFPNEKIGVLTLNRSLSVLLKNLVKRLCLGAEGKNIVVESYYDYFQKIVQHLGAEKYLTEYIRLLPEGHPMQVALSSALNKHNDIAQEFSPRSGETLKDTWREFWYDEIEKEPELLRIKNRLNESIGKEFDLERYLREEFVLIRSAFGRADRSKDTEAGYYEYDRAGRCIPFNSKVRRMVLRLLLRYEEYMFAGHMLDELGLGQVIFSVISNLRDLPNELQRRCLLIDEFQDFSTIELRLLKQIPPASGNALFLTGDTAQKVMVKDFKLSKALLDQSYVTTRTIRKNFRNSKQILEAASMLVQHHVEYATDADGGFEFLNPEFAVRETSYPIALKSNLVIESAWDLADEWMQNGCPPWSVCLATANEDEISVESIIEKRSRNIKASQLTGDYIEKKDTVSVCTLSDVKGFEFSLIVIVGCCARTIPNRTVPEAEQWRDALRLYVAMTRGRDQVVLTYKEAPSPFLEVMRTKLNWKEVETTEREIIKPETALSPRFSSSGMTQKPSMSDSQRALDEIRFGEMKLSSGAEVLLRSYFERRVYRPLDRGEGKGARKQFSKAYRKWRKPSNVSDVNVRELLFRREDRKDLLKEIDEELKRHGFKLNH